MKRDGREKTVQMPDAFLSRPHIGEILLFCTTKWMSKSNHFLYTQNIWLMEKNALDLVISTSAVVVKKQVTFYSRCVGIIYLTVM